MLTGEKKKIYQKEYMKKYRIKNVEKMANSGKKYHLLNKDKASIRGMRHNYGITKEQYKDMLSKQQNVCKFCKKVETMCHFKTGTIYRLSVDHDHSKPKGLESIRGLVCNRCNKNIIAANTLETAKQLVEYLQNN